MDITGVSIEVVCSGKEVVSNACDDSIDCDWVTGNVSVNVMELIDRSDKEEANDVVNGFNVCVKAEVNLVSNGVMPLVVWSEAKVASDITIDSIGDVGLTATIVDVSNCLVDVMSCSDERLVSGIIDDVIDDSRDDEVGTELIGDALDCKSLNVVGNVSVDDMELIDCSDEGRDTDVTDCNVESSIVDVGCVSEETTAIVCCSLDFVIDSDVTVIKVGFSDETGKTEVDMVCCTDEKILSVTANDTIDCEGESSVCCSSDITDIINDGFACDEGISAGDVANDSIDAMKLLDCSDEKIVTDFSDCNGLSVESVSVKVIKSLCCSEDDALEECVICDGKSDDASLVINNSLNVVAFSDVNCNEALSIDISFSTAPIVLSSEENLFSV